MNIEPNRGLIIEYAKAFNHLDSSYVKDLLDENFQYASQWVFDEIKNKRNYLDYFEAKLNTIKNSNTKVVAQIAIYHNQSCIVLYQIDLSKKMEIQTSTLLVRVDNGKFTRADMCMIPTVNEVHLLDEIPN